MLSYTITIGRNVGTEPMSEPDWVEFRVLVEQTIETLLRPDALFVYDGMGEWSGDAEESTAFLAISEVPAGAALDHRLGMLAEAFGQEAIGWSVGDAHLATPSPRRARATHTREEVPSND